MHIAAENGFVNIAELLLAHGDINVNCQTIENTHILMAFQKLNDSYHFKSKISMEFDLIYLMELKYISFNEITT